MLNRKTKSKAFSLVELLTVISIIALIIGLLVPGLNKVRIIGKNMKQKAQFHAMTTGIEMFKSEQDEYPDSSESTQVSTSRVITGAHKLAEALVGRDLQGYDPQTTMDDPTDDSKNAYGSGTKSGFNAQDLLEESLDRRKGPYISLDNLTALEVDKIYDTATGIYFSGGAPEQPAPVILDIYTAKQAQIPLSNGTVKTVQVGTPILYYKANIANKFNNSSVPTGSIYNIEDNDKIVLLPTIKDKNIRHKIVNDTNYDDDGNPATTAINGLKNFYSMIENSAASVSIKATNPNMSRPYRPDSYILISAGYDGIYGTRDDITNYEE